jgi:hypothetical protein
MSAVVNSLNIGALASQANGGSSLQICGMNSSGRGFMVTIAFVMWVCLYVIEIQCRLSICVQFKDFPVLEDF